jgi:hypothetical protein
MDSIPIFATNPSVSAHDTEDKTSVVITDDELTQVLQGRAPATGITVEQKVDYSISKSLKRDFIVDTFGDSPVHIGLDGLTILNSTCLDTEEKALTMEQFYAKHKLSADSKNRVNIGLSGGGKEPQSFVCVLVGMRSTSAQDDSKRSLIRYHLDLVGVTRTGGTL